MALQPGRLLEAYGTAVNSKTERKADPGQTSNVKSTQKAILLA